MAVVASLVFVGWEIRQNTAAQRSQARQAHSDAASDWQMRMAESPGLAVAFDAMLQEEGAAVSPQDSARVNWAILAVLRRMENLYLQTKEGVLDESVLATYGFTGGVFDWPGFRSYWREELRRDIFDPGFIETFERMNDLND